MNVTLIIANSLIFLAFFAHTFVGDKEAKLIEPNDNDEKKTEKWTQLRCGWHWVSFDQLFISVGLALINFTDFFSNEILLVNILTIYFLGLSITWLIPIFISKKFSKNYFKLGQWMLLLLISGLLFFGNK